MTRAALAISSSTTMSGDIVADETLRKRLEEFCREPREIWIDEHTRRRLEELCSQMASVYGLVESVLQLAMTKQGTERTRYIEVALEISSRATRTIKLFLSEWSVLAEEGNRIVLRTVKGLTQSALQRQSEDAVLPTLPTLDEICDAYIQQVLDLCGGNRQRTAQILGIGRTTLYRYECASLAIEESDANT